MYADRFPQCQCCLHINYTKYSYTSLLIASGVRNADDRSVQHLTLSVTTHHQHPSSIRGHTVPTEQDWLLRVQQNVMSLCSYHWSYRTERWLGREDEGRSIDLWVWVNLQENRGKKRVKEWGMGRTERGGDRKRRGEKRRHGGKGWERKGGKEKMEERGEGEE